MKWLDTAAAEVTAVMVGEAAAVVAEAVVDTAIRTALPWVADAGGKLGMSTPEGSFYTFRDVSTAFQCSFYS